MKTLGDISAAFELALRESFRRRCELPYADWRLWYMPQTAEHNGAIIIASEKPANPAFVPSEKLNMGADDTQLANYFRLMVFPRLPVLRAE